MNIYISGKIGKDNPSKETLAKFKEAEDMLKSKGHEVFNPTTSGFGNHAEKNVQTATYETSFYQEILLMDLVQLSQCDAVLILSDWHRSPGAKVEIMLATALDIPIYYEAPNGRLIEMKFDVRKLVCYEKIENAITVGQLSEALKDFDKKTPVTISADFLLGEPFEQGFDKQIHGNVNDVLIGDSMKAPKGVVCELESFFTCSLNFD